MKKSVLEFFRRGLIACGIGPLVLAIIYLILKYAAGVQLLTVDQVCMGIISMSILAFIAGGMNAIYQIEQLPLLIALLIHGCVLYISYLITYLINGWLEWGIIPVVVFTAIFVLGYLVIWAIIYCVIKRKTDKLNEILKKKQEKAEKMPE